MKGTGGMLDMAQGFRSGRWEKRGEDRVVASCEGWLDI